MSDQKSIWERIALSLGALLVPVVVAYVGNSFSKAVKDREVEGKFVELALNILQEEPTEETQPLRDWAVDVVDKYSGISMAKDARESLKNEALRISQPSREFISPSGERYVIADPIVDNGRFSWGEATRDGDRIPEDQEAINNIIRLAEELEKVRDFVGRPIFIASWYRTPGVNARIGGSPTSIHLTGLGADIQAEGMSALELYEKLDPWWGDRGGLGIYPYSNNVVHIDVRGYKSRWGYPGGPSEDPLSLNER